MFTLSKLFTTMHSKKGQTVSSFHGTHNFTSAGHMRDFYTVKERSHIANAHLKIIRYDPRALLKDKKKDNSMP